MFLYVSVIEGKIYDMSILIWGGVFFFCFFKFKNIVVLDLCEIEEFEEAVIFLDVIGGLFIILILCIVFFFFYVWFFGWWLMGFKGVGVVLFCCFLFSLINSFMRFVLLLVLLLKLLLLRVDGNSGGIVILLVRLR